MPRRADHSRLSAALGLIGLTLVVAGCTGTGDPEPGEPSTPAASTSTATPDFDGDGAADLVAGIGEAVGRVTVRYAGGRTQDLRPADVHAADSPGFGRAILARDLDGDGFTDLVIGDPGQVDAPGVFLVPGSAAGLDPTKAHSVTAPSGLVGFGGALAVVESPSTVLVVGAPGDGQPLPAGPAPSPTAPENRVVGGAVATWSLDPDGAPTGDPRVLTLDSDGFPGGKAGDAFGGTLAATGSWLAIGAPRRDAGGTRDAGSVFALDLSTDPGQVHELGQGRDGAGGTPQAEDRFGFALAAGHGYLAVSAPMDDEDGRDAGAVQPYRLTAQGPVAEEAVLPSGLGASAPAGGLFGISLATARPCPGVDGLVVGAPGTAAGGVSTSGAVWLVPLARAADSSSASGASDPAGSGCSARELVEGGALGGSPVEMASLGRAVSAWTGGAGGPDTVVLAAPGVAEESIPGRVLTLAPPFTGPAQTALDGIRLHEEGVLTLSPAG